MWEAKLDPNLPLPHASRASLSLGQSFTSSKRIQVKYLIWGFINGHN